VRREERGETSVIHEINTAAFDRPDEADLVDSLRAESAVLLSLVAELEQRIVGHILFSRMWIDGDGVRSRLRHWHLLQCCPTISVAESVRDSSERAWTVCAKDTNRSSLF
jgi:hypothetical protein